MRVTQRIAISLIQMDSYPLNPSTLSLIKFLESGGEVPPIKVLKIDNGLYKIKDGRHRITAFKLLGINKIKATFSLKKNLYENNNSHIKTNT